MGIFRHKSEKINSIFPLLLATGLLGASTLGCSLLQGSPTESTNASPPGTAIVITNASPTSTAKITPTETQSPTSTPATAFYTNPSIGFNLTYPAGWTIYEYGDIVTFTRPDRLAEITLGWYTMIEGQSIAKVAERLAVITVEEQDLSELIIIFTENEGGNSVDGVVRGDNPQGVEWVYRFVVAEGGERALVITTAAIAADDEAMKALFEDVMLSLETVPN